MKYLILVTIIYLVGCEGRGGQLPYGINNEPRPLVLAIKSSEGIILRDADGRLHAYSNSYYFVRTIIASDAAEGDIIADVKNKGNKECLK